MVRAGCCFLEIGALALGRRRWERLRFLFECGLGRGVRAKWRLKRVAPQRDSIRRNASRARETSTSRWLALVSEGREESVGIATRRWRCEETSRGTFAEATTKGWRRLEDEEEGFRAFGTETDEKRSASERSWEGSKRASKQRVGSAKPEWRK